MRVALGAAHPALAGFSLQPVERLWAQCCVAAHFCLGLIGIFSAVLFCLGGIGWDVARFGEVLSGQADGLTWALRIVGVLATFAVVWLVGRAARRAQSNSADS